MNTMSSDFTKQRLGAFEILDRLGAGAMGEVYRAKDTKLGREVAIKVLPDVFARDKDLSLIHISEPTRPY